MCVFGTTAKVARRCAALLALAARSPCPPQPMPSRCATPAGRNVEVKDASRIVSVGGAVTEILYALGLSDRIVAVDTTSLFPAEALKQKPNVGYMRALSAEGVLGLNPSLVLAIEGAGPKETVAVLEAATVPLVRVPDRYTGDGIVEKIRMVADVAGEHDRGKCLAGKVGDDLAALTRLREKITQPKKVLFVLSLLNGKPMVAGRNTAADGIIKLAGGVNAIDAYEGYKQISDEAVIAAGPDTVLVMQRQQEPLDAKTVFAHAAFATTPAAAQKSFVVDGRALSARLRPAHRDGGARSRAVALSCAGPRGPAVGTHAVRLLLMTIAAPGEARLSGRWTLRSPVVVLGVLAGVLVIAAAVAASVGAAGIPLSRLPAALGLGAGRSRDRRARPARAVVDPPAAHRARHHDRRAARGRRHRDAGAVPQSARRSGARRHLARRGVRGRDSRSWSATGCSPRARPPCRSRCCPSRRSRARWSRPSSSIASRRAPAAPRSRRCCSPASRSARSPMPASASWCSSPTTGNCATSRSGCSARSAAPPGARRWRSRRSSR